MICDRSLPLRDTTKTGLVELELAHWLAAHAVVPEVEVHVDADATWMLGPGIVWQNCATRLRFDESAVDARLTHLLERYEAQQRGAGFWVSPLATPADLPQRLGARGLRCRKQFPAMHLDLRLAEARAMGATDLTFEVVDNHQLFESHPHPYFGPIRTPMRRFEMRRLTQLNAQRPRRIWDLVALRGGVPIAGCTLQIDDAVVGFHDVGVVPSARREGVGTALMSHACWLAREQGATDAVLVSSGEGVGLYTRVGFVEVARIGYWYRQFRSSAGGLTAARERNPTTARRLALAIDEAPRPGRRQR